MENYVNTRLYGGLFLELLTVVRKSRKTKKENLNGDTDELSDSNLLSELIKTISPSHYSPEGSTKNNNASLYKTCKLDHSDWLNFTDDLFIEECRYALKNDYKNCLIRMNKFIYDYLDTENNYRMAYIVSSLVDIIKNDETIDSNETFYLGTTLGAIKKDELNPSLKITVQEFLLSVWGYILTKPINNKVGLDFYDSIHGKAKGVNKQRPLMNLSLNTSEYIVTLLSANDVKFDMDCKAPVNIKPFSYSRYLKKMSNKYSSLKTLLYTQTPKEFKSFYECNNVLVNSHSIIFNFLDDFDFDIDEFADAPFLSDSLIKDITIEKLQKKLSNFFIITGTGGLGKSMMMRHLLLDTIDNFNTYKMIPLFILLKDYDNSNQDFFHYLYSNIKDLAPGLSQIKFEESLSKGEFLIILDGLDEIGSKYTSHFQKQLDSFIDKYSGNLFIMSSRPYENFVEYSRFTIAQLCPLSQKQANSLIHKLHFRDDMPTIREKFIKQLNDTLFTSHHSFASNPLLLTIMLMTFESYAEIPSKMHIFYREAYETLAKRHDASKGSYKRELKTNLASDTLADYISEFCCRSYRDDVFDFKPSIFQKFFNSLKEHEKHEVKIQCSDFIDDLTNGLCLLYFEGGNYHFTHRSFQEYFAAVFFSKMKDKNLGKVGSFFEKNNKRGDKTFRMLYDMNKSKVEEYILLPLLNELFKKIDSKESEEETFMNFMKYYHPKVIYTVGKVDRLERYFENCTDSFLINFIEKSESFVMPEPKFPFVKEYVKEEYVAIKDEDSKHFRTIPLSKLEHSNQGDDSPNPTSWLLELDLLKGKINPDVLKCIVSSDSPFVLEYQFLLKHRDVLATRYSNVDEDDMFEYL